MRGIKKVSPKRGEDSPVIRGRCPNRQTTAEGLPLHLHFAAAPDVSLSFVSLNIKAVQL